MSTFTIDYFELMFLAEACIPPRPIARMSFWHDLINVHYNAMLPNERSHAFNWLKDKLDLKDEDCRLFYARFNPDNQYLVRALYQGTHSENECFLWEGKYHTARHRFVNPDNITSVEKISYEEEKAH